MSQPIPLFASEKTAAKLMDMTPAEFLRLVSDGHLPPCTLVGGIRRWETEKLRQIASGDAAFGGEMEF